MTKKSLLLCCIAIATFSCFANSKSKSKKTNSEKTMHDLNSIAYPYVASEQRMSQIKENCNNLKRCMSETEIVNLLGKPDDLRFTYNTVKSGKIAGKSYLYLLSQKKLHGSYIDKQQVAIRFHFNTQGKLIRAYGIATPFFKDIIEVTNDKAYPYRAQENRVSRIKKNCSQLELGLSQNKANALLGTPDEITKIYDASQERKIVGELFLYLISQDQENGSKKEKNQKSITVYFDTKGKLTHASGMNTSFFKGVAPDQDK